MKNRGNFKILSHRGRSTAGTDFPQKFAKIVVFFLQIRRLCCAVDWSFTTTFRQAIDSVALEAIRSAWWTDRLNSVYMYCSGSYPFYDYVTLTGPSLCFGNIYGAGCQRPHASKGPRALQPFYFQDIWSLIFYCVTFYLILVYIYFFTFLFYTRKGFLKWFLNVLVLHSACLVFLKSRLHSLGTRVWL